MEADMRFVLDRANDLEEHLSVGYQKAYSCNLPLVTRQMFFEYMVRLMKAVSGNDSQLKALQASTANNAEFDDDSIGCVQLKREDSGCTLKGQIHSISPSDDGESAEIKIYQLSVVIDEENHTIESIECSDCTEVGCCQHTISLLLWLHNQNQLGTHQELECFFRTPLVTELEQIPPKPILNKTKAKNFIREIVHGLQTEDIDCPLRWNFSSVNKKYSNLSIHELIMCAVKNGYDLGQFFDHAQAVVGAASAVLAEKVKFQPRFYPWFQELRYGRITGAKVYDCATLNVARPLLYETILGCNKELDTAVQRKKLAIRQRLEKYTKMVYENPRISMHASYPVIFDVPDGICQSHVVEIKCPRSHDHMKKYVTDDGSINEKYYLEMQVHMLLYGKTAGVVCVADPDFENNNDLYMHSFNLNKQFATKHLQKAVDYWKNNVFPELVSSWSE
uniref:YqaJ viral recombinase domain-containing protein n=1 Tax=Anopheles atroparvus TaxID=41427 RepID=A0A182IM45_ANOAO